MVTASAETGANAYARVPVTQGTSTIQTLTASEARANLYRLMDQAVLVSAEDWEAIQETLFLLSVPGMRESIKEGMEEPVECGSTALDW